MPCLVFHKGRWSLVLHFFFSFSALLRNYCDSHLPGEFFFFFQFLSFFTESRNEIFKCDSHLPGETTVFVFANIVYRDVESVILCQPIYFCVYRASCRTDPFYNHIVLCYFRISLAGPACSTSHHNPYCIMPIPVPMHVHDPAL